MNRRGFFGSLAGAALAALAGPRAAAGCDRQGRPRRFARDVVRRLSGPEPQVVYPAEACSPTAQLAGPDVTYTRVYEVRFVRAGGGRRFFRGLGCGR